jgi:hypothetical protein
LTSEGTGAVGEGIRWALWITQMPLNASRR